MGARHGSAAATGAIAGVLVAALMAGSLVLVIVLALGAVVGGMVAAAGAVALDGVRGRRTRSGDRPAPTLTPQGEPDAQRAEAGGPSPEPASTRR